MEVLSLGLSVLRNADTYELVVLAALLFAVAMDSGKHSLASCAHTLCRASDDLSAMLRRLSALRAAACLPQSCASSSRSSQRSAPCAATSSRQRSSSAGAMPPTASRWGFSAHVDSQLHMFSI